LAISECESVTPTKTSVERVLETAPVPQRVSGWFITMVLGCSQTGTDGYYKCSDTRPTLVNPLSPKTHAKNIGKVGVQGATVAKANGLGARNICSLLFTAPSPPSQHLQPWAQIDR